MIRAKLFILRQEIDLLWTDMNYVRQTKVNGKPITEVLGGEINMGFEANRNSDILARWITKVSDDDTFREVDRMEEGEIRFYEDGFDDSPKRIYKFNDAYPIYFEEVFNAEDEHQFQINLSISPAIQEYGSKLIKDWNINYIPPNDQKDTEEEQEKEDPQFLGYHFENQEGEKIEQNKIRIDDVIYLVVETENADGEKITLNLDDDNLDYEYNGKVLENDTLKGVSVTGSVTKVKLTAVAQGSGQEG
ncbi:MAG: type VI secretion system tube protein TssD [Crocinitomicaceae bacterium]|nr:type VI secretion system tube protein TssD [Crocinitomicaceae bacterium]